MPTPKVELNIGGTWTDITSDVRAAGGVQISRGAQDEQPTVVPGTMRLELEQSGGKYNGRNPLSPYYGQLGRNTPIRVGVDPMSDTFTRTVVDGWDTSSSGHTWTLVGTAANFDVTGTAGTITGNSQFAVLPNRYGQVDVLVKFRLSSLTGQPRAGIVTHWQNSSNHFQIAYDNLFGGLVLVRFATGGSATMDIGSFSVSAGVDYWIRGRVNAAVIQGRIWADGDPEPDTWTASARPDEDSSVVPLLTGGKVGLFIDFGSSATATFDSLDVVSYRFHGEVRSWPPRWDKSGHDVSVPIEAVGILNRLGSSGQATLQSAMFREATKSSTSQYMTQYWPCEDGADATRFASAVSRGPAANYVAASLANNTNIPGSKPLPTFSTGAYFQGQVPASPDTTGAVYYRMVLDVPSSHSVPNDADILNIYVDGGNVRRFGLEYGTGGTLELIAVDLDNFTAKATTGLQAFSIDGKRFYLSIELVQNGSDTDWLIAVNSIAADNASVSNSLASGTFTSVTVGHATLVTIGGEGTMDGWGFGHVGVGNNQSFMFGMTDALIGNSGETAGDRLVRVAEEAGIALQVIGDPADTALMGPQVPGSALDVLRSCAEADQGILFESRNEFGLTYRTLSSIYSQSGPVLDYGGGHVNVFDPTEDDFQLYNDVTVTRVNGSSARATLDSGILSTQEPPDGAGRIEAPALDVAVQSDLQLDNIASWRLHNTTWDEQRFRTLGVQQGATELRNDPDLWAQLAALDSGDQVCVDNPPSWLPSDRIRQLVRGYSEVISEDGADLWSIDWNASPAGPYDTGLWGSSSDPDSTDTEARYDTHTPSTLASTTTTSTTWSVSTSTVGPNWTTDANDLPFDVMVEGERATVTAISGASTPQTFTVTRSVNGVVKAHDTGAVVELADPVYWAL